MTLLNFWKMQGAGNDFVVLDALSDALSDALPEHFDFAGAAKVLCARGFGAGGDGLLLLDQPGPDAQHAGAAIRMRMWNPDGSEDMCGNGLRCIVRLAHELKHVTTTQFLTQTIAGLRACEVLSAHEIRVAMGEPRFARKDIPMRPAPLIGYHKARYRRLPDPATIGVPDGADCDVSDLSAASAIEYDLQAQGAGLGTFSSLSTGSTHTVTFDRPHPIPDATFEQHSRLIENHPAFPERTSVLWAQVVERDRLKVRIWERGVGETLACGTGACAAAIVAQVTKRCEPGEHGIGVESRGGTLRVKWQPGREIFLSGPAQIVYRGVWNR